MLLQPVIWHSDSGQMQPVTIDLCSGMGGLSLAAMALGLRVAVGVDTSEASMLSFSRNFINAKAVTGSVRSKKVLAECQRAVAPYLDSGSPLIIVSGPPCQGFSAAGSRNPTDVRNQILCSVARAIVHLQPVCALIENVAALLTPPHEHRLAHMKRILTGGGYRVTNVLLDAADYGAAQRRRRAFFLITRQPLDTEALNRQLACAKVIPPTVADVLSDLPTPDVRPDVMSEDIDDLNLPNHLAMKHSPRVIAKISAIKPGTGPMSYRRLHPDRISNTLFSGHRAPPAHYCEPRSITVREAARLQGFPDTFRIYGTFAAQMQQVTNAVPLPLGVTALKVLLGSLGGDE